MVDVVLANKNITVLGGPAKIDLDLNIGGEGRRGSLFFSGFEDPNSLSLEDFPQTPLVFDLYVLSNPASDRYLSVYQYVNQDGEFVWVIVFTLNKSQYSVNKVATFTSGQTEIILDLDEIGLNNLQLSTLSDSFAYFAVQATLGNYNLADALSNGFDTPVDLNPVSHTVQVGSLFFDNEGGDPGSSFDFPLKLPIRIKAVEFSGGAWSPINNKDVVVSLSIDFVNPNEILFYSSDLDPESSPEEPAEFVVTNSGASAYTIDGESNPTLTLVRGRTYVFDINASGHPFWIQTVSGAYNSQNVYNDGITGNGTQVGTLTWVVGQSTPDTLYYVCQFHSAMQGTINIIDEGDDS
jgi:hypothetical protein